MPSQPPLGKLTFHHVTSAQSPSKRSPPLNLPPRSLGPSQTTSNLAIPAESAIRRFNRSLPKNRKFLKPGLMDFRSWRPWLPSHHTPDATLQAHVHQRKSIRKEIALFRAKLDGQISSHIRPLVLEHLDLNARREKLHDFSVTYLTVHRGHVELALLCTNIVTPTSNFRRVFPQSPLHEWENKVASQFSSWHTQLHSYWQIFWDSATYRFVQNRLPLLAYKQRLELEAEYLFHDYTTALIAVEDSLSIHANSARRKRAEYASPVRSSREIQLLSIQQGLHEILDEDRQCRLLLRGAARDRALLQEPRLWILYAICEPIESFCIFADNCASTVRLQIIKFAASRIPSVSKRRVLLKTIMGVTQWNKYCARTSTLASRDLQLFVAWRLQRFSKQDLHLDILTSKDQFVRWDRATQDRIAANRLGNKQLRDRLKGRNSKILELGQ